MKPLRSSYPRTTLLGGMTYRNSASTDLRLTFDRVRAEQDRQRRERDRAIEDADAWIAEQVRVAR